MTTSRLLFADQLGTHFLGDDEQPIVLIESTAALRRRRLHRARAHLVLSALRHRAAELGERATVVRAETYGEALERVKGPVEVVHPTSREALAVVRRHGLRVLPARGFITSHAFFEEWAASNRLQLEGFYRHVRRHTGVLMADDKPEGGRWNYDADNRQPPPRGATELGAPQPWWPEEDEIDDEVRRDLDTWDIPTIGADGPRRFAATTAEAEAALQHFIVKRLPLFGPHEDAMLDADPWMAHSMLSVPLNLGLLDPQRAVAAAARADAPLASREGFVRQVLGWREYIWHLYWHLGPDYRRSNALSAHAPLPRWFQDLDADDVSARCLASALQSVRDYGWAHHIQRLMVLGSWALQRGYDPAALSDWFRASFVDGAAWVMDPNVIGMSQYADGGVVATKPYTSGGAYLHRMSDHCSSCRYSPQHRSGDTACPFTTGYWAFLQRNADALAGNRRMQQPLASMRRLRDLAEAIESSEQFDRDSPP